MGDINIDLLVNNSSSKSWLDLTENFQLQQLITEPTRITPTSTTLIDHIFTSSSAKVRRVKVPKIGLSDHFPTCAVFKDVFGTKHCHTNIKHRSFKTFDQEQFLNDLNQCKWNLIDNVEDIDTSLETWYSLFQSVIDKHSPLKTKRVKRVKQPEWMTNEILQCMHERDECKRTQDFLQYKVLRNKCVSLIREAKKTYYQTCINNNKGNSSKLWKYINQLAPKESKSTPTMLKDGDVILTNKLDICESFNNYFSTVVNQYLPAANQSLNFQKLKDFVSSTLPDDAFLSIPSVSCDYVLKSLTELDLHKATGLDGLSSNILKISAPAIASSLTIIFNRSISTGYFPMKWKTARITPIHKAGDHTDKNNYRPISILPIISKLLERHVHMCISDYLSSYNLLYTAQSGFRPRHSCETALVKLVDSWLSNIEDGKLNGLILVDFRKAFDMINLDILIAKLECYHFDNTLINWMRSYLTGRSQCVKVKDTLSSLTPVSFGVPQGSILGPLLFILFVNDLPLQSKLHIDLYVDDSTFHTSGNSINELNTTLSSAMEDVQLWCSSNGMVVNESKTMCMVVCTHQKAARIGSTDLHVTYNGTLLKNVECEKLLGVNIDSHLSWKMHINDLASTLSKCIALFRRIRVYLPLQSRILFYKTFFQPRIDYCNIVWGQSSHISRIYKLQKLILRLIYSKPKLFSSGPLFEQSLILPIEYRVMFRVVTLVYKALNGLSPEYICNMLRPLSSMSQRTTRSSSNKNLWIPNFKLSITRKGLRYNGALLYNSMPVDIKATHSIKLFKQKAYKYFLDMFIISS